MNRRDFGKTVAAVATVAVVAPKILEAETEQDHLEPFPPMPWWTKEEKEKYLSGPYEHRGGCNHFWAETEFYTLRSGERNGDDPWFEHDETRVLKLTRDDGAVFAVWQPRDKRDVWTPMEREKIDKYLLGSGTLWFLDAVYPLSKTPNPRPEKACPIHWEAA
jgi:hypothetical protein